LVSATIFEGIPVAQGGVVPEEVDRRLELDSVNESEGRPVLVDNQISDLGAPVFKEFCRAL
jgi:hypothetical protein